jgi:histidyl-tRNA synthetase
VKLWYHWPMFRYEAPQSGRYRQHYQIGAEVFGSESPLVDAEIIGMLAALYRDIDLQAVELRLNSMGCRECRPAYTTDLRRYLEGNVDRLCGECKERTAANPLRTFDCKVPSCGEVLEEAPRLTDYLCPRCEAHHNSVKHGLQLQGMSFAEDHRLVRGMDYYTRTTFEFQSPVLGAQAGVGGGGRYDNLVESIGGPPTPGVGFGSGVERILLALERSSGKGRAAAGPAAYIVALSPAVRPAAFLLAHELRARGVAAELDYQDRSAKGQMKQAGRTGARYAVIVGEAEMASGTVTLRDLATGVESKPSRSEAIALAEVASGVQGAAGS